MRDHSVVRLASRVTVICSALTSDLMWSDPDEVDAWAVSPRGAGWLFGAKVTAEVGLCFHSSTGASY